MLNNIISFSIKNKLIIGLFTLALLAYGAYQTTKLPIDAVPDVTDNQVQVITVSPSLGAPDIERLITFPIEQACSSIPGKKSMRSFSRFGLSLVTIVFEDDIDLLRARQQIGEKLQTVTAGMRPGMGKPEMAPITTGLGEIYQYVVRAKPGYEKKYSLQDLRTIQDWMVRRQLLGTPGVADVSTFGGELKQYEVAVKPELLKAFNLTIDDVFDALEANNENTGGAYIEKGPTVLYIRSEGLVTNKKEIENIFVKTTNKNMPVLISNIADVRIGTATRYGAVCFNAEGEVTGAVVMMLKGENSSNVIKNVKERIEQIQKTLPEGVIIEPFLDRTKMVNNAIHTVEVNLAEGALIVVFVLVFFLANLRAGLIVASVIPLSMLFAIIMMNLFHVGGNLMSLGAIDFGLIVDGAVIVVEAVMHQLTHSKHFIGVNRLTQDEMDREVNHSSSKIMNAVVFGQIIILIVYLPILTLEGIEGKMFKPMAQTVSFAILGAFLLSLTYVPMMSALFISKKIAHKKTFSDKLMEKVERVYQKALERALNIPRTIIISSVLLFAIASFIMSGLGGEFIPELEEGDFAVETRVLTGSSLKTTIAATQKASKILLDNFPEVQKVVTKIGSGEIPTDPMPMEAGDLMIILKDKSAWTSATSFEELGAKMSEKISAVPGITTSFQFPVQMRFNELMTGAKQDVVCKIFGDDLDTLAKYAAKISELASTVEGTTEFYVEQVTGMPQLIIDYNDKAIAQYGMSVKELNRTLNSAFAGGCAGMVYEGEKQFDLVVRVDSSSRKSIRDVRDLLVSTSTGMQIPLSQVAEIKETDGPNQIQRENTRRRIIVGFNIRGKDVQTIVTELQKKVDAKIKFPPGYSVTYGGTFENLQAAKERLVIVVPVALLMIFLMLYFAFSSVKQGMLIYSAIPLSAIGGIIALWIRDMPFSISAGVGFIALFGVAVLNGIVLISEFRRLIAEGWSDYRKIVVMGTKIRLRSILMTAFAPSLGFFPMAFSAGAGAEVQRPLATVVIGGIVSATLLTLFVLPVLFVWSNRKKENTLKTNKAVTILVAFLSLTGITSAQSSEKSISLKDAVEKVLKNNPDMKAARLNEQQSGTLRKTWLDMNKTMIGFDYGKYNGLYNDQKISISQSILFPTVYTNQKKELAENHLSAIQGIAVMKQELTTVISKVYYEYIRLEMKERTLLFADSVYRLFEERAKLRFEKGETNQLEKITAETQRSQIHLQLEMTRADKSISLKKFNFLLMDTTTAFVPLMTDGIIPDIPHEDTAGAHKAAHVLVQLHKAQASRWAWKTEKSKMLPDFFVAYNNQSLSGFYQINGNDVFIGNSKRFVYWSAGIGLPVFFGANKARIQSGKLNYKMQLTEYEWTKDLAAHEIHIAYLETEKYKKMLQDYKSKTLKNTDVILTTANKQLQAGEIDYLQWVMLINQVITIQNEYTDIKNSYNQSIIDFNDKSHR